MSRIDYSKWDHFDDDDDEDDDDDNRQQVTSSSSNLPRVTRLDQPSRITRTAQGEIIIEDKNASSSIISSEAAVYPPPILKQLVADQQKSNNRQEEENAVIPASWTEKGSSESIGGGGCRLYWSQDRYSVTLRILLPSAPPGSSNRKKEERWECECANILPFDNRNSAVGTSCHPGHLVIGRRAVVNGGNETWTEILVESDLPHPVHAAEDDVDQGVDWSIETLGLFKFAVITFYKATPMPGMTLWWKRPLLICPNEIAIDWRPDNTETSSFSKAWEEAHERFKEARTTENPEGA